MFIKTKMFWKIREKREISASCFSRIGKPCNDRGPCKNKNSTYAKRTMDENFAFSLVAVCEEMASAVLKAANQNIKFSF